jgi:hypothetical protein
MGLGLVPAVDSGVDLLPHMRGWKPTRLADPKPRSKVLLPGNLKVRNEPAPIPVSIIRAPNVSHPKEHKRPGTGDRGYTPTDGDDNREDTPEDGYLEVDEVIFGGGGESMVSEPLTTAAPLPEEDGLWLVRERLRRIRLDRKLGLRPIIVPSTHPFSPPQSTPTKTQHRLDDTDDWPPSDSVRLHYPPPPSRRHMAVFREVEDFLGTVKQASMGTTSLEGGARFERFEALVDLRAEVLAWERAILDDTLVEWESEGRMVGVDAEAVRRILEKWKRELDRILERA